MQIITGRGVQLYTPTANLFFVMVIENYISYTYVLDLYRRLRYQWVPLAINTF
ncbi:hypothetical protein NIES4103_15580 [Nostoc sp. NIES-4103]|nr:hypothetical protein NIES4103_15580 [Nostoc sp. NIES-4103]